MKQAGKDRTPARTAEQEAEDTAREAALKAFALVKAVRELKAAPR
ncbi:MAG TPA: hypothetical protein PLI70_01375 [Gemmatimonadales bacterium]|nr:hypothetical protein [Gemmatimonadales bacterium]HRZ09357.1 hypothetical protein [Gemmatimonadales bacterium]